MSATTYPRTVTQTHSCHRAAMLSLLLQALVNSFFGSASPESYQIWTAAAAAPTKLDEQEPAMPAARSRTWSGDGGVGTKDQWIGVGRVRRSTGGCAPVEARVSGTVQPTGKMEKTRSRNLPHCGLWRSDVWVEADVDVFFLEPIGTHGPANRAGARAESVFPRHLTRRLEGRSNLQKEKSDAGPHHSTRALSRRLECCARGDLRAMAGGEAKWEGDGNGRGPTDVVGV